MKIKNFKFLTAVLAVIAAMQISFISCSDEPGIDSYYTTTKEYAADYLKNRAQYSDYLEILSRATGSRGDLRLIDLLGTYGSYTVFAPTNDAIQSYLKSMGKTSLDQLTKEDCDTIALNSIIEQAYFTTDIADGTYRKANMLEHIMSITCDSLVEDGNIKLQLKINNTAILTHYDDSVCNGVVHTVGKVVSTSNELLDGVMAQDSTISLYNEALEITGVKLLLQAYLDESYKIEGQNRIDSCTWTNNKLCIFTAAEYDNVAYPENRYFNFTAYMVKDEVLLEKYGITTVRDNKEKTNTASLEHLAHEIYDDMYPEDKDIDSLTDRRNALNRFISYHILDRYAPYYGCTAVDAPTGKLCNNFNRRKYDIRDWYPTLMPHSSLKISFPSGSQQGLYINRRGVQSRPDERGVFIRGAKVAPANQGPTNATAINGMYHYIDDIISYGRQTQEVVFNDRIRLDCSTLSPDFMTKLSDGEMARGHSCRVAANNGLYGLGGQGATASANVNTCIGFKAGFCRNIKYTDNTHLHVRMRVLGFWSYQGDEVTVKGPFDIEVTLPPVPEGTYEIRMMTCVGFTSRGIMQAYIDGIPQGIPFDMRPGGEQLFGYQSDDNLGDDDAITAFDKAIHNIGWMKGPGCYGSGEKDTWGGTTFRNQNNTIRRVLGTFYTDGKSDHVLRLQQKMESGGEMNFDFIELCPSSVYNNEYYAEDKY